MNQLDTPFTVTVATEDRGPRLVLGGRVDRDAESALLASFADAAGPGVDRVVLDFADTDYVNSSGLAAVVAVLTEARARDVAVAARGLTDHYRHLFEITRLTDLVELEPPTATT